MGARSLCKVLVDNDNEDILIDVCWALSYITNSGEDRVSLILETGALPKLVQLLNHTNIGIQVPCLRVIGNVVTGTEEQT